MVTRRDSISVREILFVAAAFPILIRHSLAVGKVNDKERDNTAVHEIWKHSHALLSISVDWPDNATAREKGEKRHKMVQLSKRFTEIVGPDGGTYVNEASP
jgi:hypothetical protein